MPDADLLNVTVRRPSDHANDRLPLSEHPCSAASS